MIVKSGSAKIKVGSLLFDSAEEVAETPLHFFYFLPVVPAAGLYLLLSELVSPLLLAYHPH